jgi:hypothetical protein
MAIEVGVSALAVALAFGWPRIGNSWFSGIEQAFANFAQKKRIVVLFVGLAQVLLRLALLPIFPIPNPISPDDFSFMLAADTFQHGRLVNPTPAMWTHFESIHITMQPTYTTMYFPAQGLVMAAGKILFGHPWYGILLMSALMCAGICWMLQAWLPPRWALLGGLLAVLRLGLFSYWVNTYTGAGTITALGGALVLGSLPRLIKSARFCDGLLMALGMVLLITSRPYEGLLLCLPVAFALGRWLMFGENRPPLAILIRRATVPLVLVLAACVWMSYYDYRAFGSPLTLPYTVDRAAYARAPYYVWQSLRPAPVYRHEEMRRFYEQDEIKSYLRIHTLAGFIPQTARKVRDGLLFFAGAVLFAPLIMIGRVLRDKRVRFLVLCMAFFLAGMAIEIYLIPHYLAAFTACFYAVGLQATRHMYVWKPEGRPVGATAVRLLLTVCIALGGLRVLADPLHLTPPEWPAQGWIWSWSGPGHYGSERSNIEASLTQSPGNHLILVRYNTDHETHDEWVYNNADIDSSKVIWAREMDAANDRELFQYYRDRTVWLVEPDKLPVSLTVYPTSADSSTKH